MEKLNLDTVTKQDLLALSSDDEFVLDGCELNGTDVEYELRNYDGVYIESTTPPVMMVTDKDSGDSYLYECEKTYAQLSEDDHEEILAYRGVDEEGICEVDDWFMSGMFMTLVGKVNEYGLEETPLGGVEVGENYYEVVQVGCKYLIAGTVCNVGILFDYKMELDNDFSLDENLQEFISDIQEWESAGHPTENLTVLRSDS